MLRRVWSLHDKRMDSADAYLAARLQLTRVRATDDVAARVCSEEPVDITIAASNV